MKTYIIQMQSLEKFEENGYVGCTERHLGANKPKDVVLRELADVGIVCRVIEKDGRNTIVYANNWSAAKQYVENR